MGLIAEGAAIVGGEFSDADEVRHAEMEKSITDCVETVGAPGGVAGTVGLNFDSYTSLLFLMSGMERPRLGRLAQHCIYCLLHVLVERLRRIRQRRVASQMQILECKHRSIEVTVHHALHAHYCH